MLIAGMIPLAKINILYCSKPIYMAQKAVFSLVSSKEKNLRILQKYNGVCWSLGEEGVAQWCVQVRECCGNFIAQMSQSVHMIKLFVPTDAKYVQHFPHFFSRLGLLALLFPFLA